MSRGVPVHRPSPLAVLLVFLGACLAPVAMLLITGLTGGPAPTGCRRRTAEAEASDAAGIESCPTTSRVGAVHHGRDGPGAGDHHPDLDHRRPRPRPHHRRPPRPPVAPPPPPPAPTTTTRPPAASPADRVVELVNAARAEAGCGPLATDERLARAAQGHADDMAAQGCFSHTSLDGRSFADRVRDAGHPRPGGENIAQGHEAWMGSPAHRDNILNCDFTAIGVGVNTGAWTWVQDFGY